MIVLVRRSHIGFSLLLLLTAACMSLILRQGSGRSAAALASVQPQPIGRIVVVDAGHGGEDGGAVAGDGTVESGLNLEIAVRLNALLRLMGQNTVMTRTEDVSIYSDGAQTLHQKKGLRSGEPGRAGERSGGRGPYQHPPEQPAQLAENAGRTGVL